VRGRQRGRAVLDHGRSKLEGAFHRDCLTRAVGEHPRHTIGEALRMTAVARAPAEV